MAYTDTLLGIDKVPFNFCHVTLEVELFALSYEPASMIESAA